MLFRGFVAAKGALENLLCHSITVMLGPDPLLVNVTENQAENEQKRNK